MRPSKERLEEIRKQVLKNHFGWPQELLAEIDALEDMIKASNRWNESELNKASEYCTIIEKERDRLKERVAKLRNAIFETPCDLNRGHCSLCQALASDDEMEKSNV